MDGSALPSIFFIRRRFIIGAAGAILWEKNAVEGFFMNKASEFIIISAAVLGLLTGCAGEHRRNADKTPTVTEGPVMVTPAADDGIVRDDDGIITDDDTGREGNGSNGYTGSMDRRTATPMPSAPASPPGSPSASPLTGSGAE